MGSPPARFTSKMSYSAVIADVCKTNLPAPPPMGVEAPAGAVLVGAASVGEAAGVREAAGVAEGAGSVRVAGAGRSVAVAGRGGGGRVAGGVSGSSTLRGATPRVQARLLAASKAATAGKVRGRALRRGMAG